MNALDTYTINTEEDIEVCKDRFLRAAGNMNLFVLVDRLQYNTLEDRLARKDISIPKEDQVELKPRNTPDNPQNPLLIQVRDQVWPILTTAIRQATIASWNPTGAHDVCGLLASPYNLAWLGQHLSKQVSIMLPGDKKESGFRFYDPRVLHVLMRYMRPLHLSYLFGPIQIWAYMDFLQTFRIIENPRPGSDVSTKVVLKQEVIDRLWHNMNVCRAMNLLLNHVDLWTSELDEELVEYVKDVDPSFGKDFDAKWNIPAIAAMRWLIYRGRAKEQLLQEAIELWEKDRVLITNGIKHLAPDLL
jgi:hypothetical protein